jgi:hypothetical protein
MGQIRSTVACWVIGGLAPIPDLSTLIPERGVSTESGGSFVEGRDYVTWITHRNLALNLYSSPPNLRRNTRRQ